MRVQKFELPDIGWKVTVFYGVTCIYLHEILNALRLAGMEKEELDKAYRLLNECRSNTGLTYSNEHTRQSVIVISVGSSAREFYNSLCHEQFHLAMQISDIMGYDVKSEESAYLVGDIAANMFAYSRDFLCDSCRNRYRNFRVGK